MEEELLANNAFWHVWQVLFENGIEIEYEPEAELYHVEGKFWVKPISPICIDGQTYNRIRISRQSVMDIANGYSIDMDVCKSMLINE